MIGLGKERMWQEEMEMMMSREGRWKRRERTGLEQEG